MVDYMNGYRTIKITAGMIPEFEIISTNAPDHVIKAQLMYIAACEEEGKQVPENPYGMIEEFGYVANVIGSQDSLTTEDLEDAVIELGDLRDTNPELANKKTVLDALARKDYEKLREISNFFYRTSGIYARLCRYMAYLYKYDWFITPYVMSDNTKSKGSDKILKSFNDALYF